MKSQACIVLIAIVIGILMPHSFAVTIAGDGNVAIGTLDVCSHAASMTVLSGEMPYLACGAVPFPPQTLVLFSVRQAPLSPFASFTIDVEQPPKA